MNWLTISPHHEKTVEQKRAANQMKYVERSDDGGIGLQKFPQETLQRVPADEKVGALAQDEFVLVRELVEKEDEEAEHRQGLVKLDGVTQHAVAEIDAPRKTGRRAVGEIGQAREEAAEAPDGDAERERRHELQAGRTFDAGEELVDLDQDDPAADRASDRMAELEAPRQTEIEAAEQKRAGDGAEAEHDEIDGIVEGRARHDAGAREPALAR